MTAADITGIIGVGLILLAYFGQVAGWMNNKNKIFFLLNASGAGLACYASYKINYWPFVMLEGVWLTVSLFGLFRIVTTYKRDR